MNLTTTCPCFDGQFGTEANDVVEIIVSPSDFVTLARCLQNLALCIG